MGASEILVIILSIFLAIFLLIAIILGVILVKISLQIKRVTTTAEKTAQNVETAVANISKYSSLSAIGSLVKHQVKNIRKKRKG